MNITIVFNFPDFDHARVSLGIPTVIDLDCEFRIGVIKNENSNSVYWIKTNRSIWFSGEVKEKIIFDVKKTEKVIVQRRKNDSEEIEFSSIWNIKEEWPADACGNQIVSVPWDF